MKKRKIFCLILAVLMISGLMTPAMAQPDAPPPEGCISLQAQKPLAGKEKLLPTAKAVILYELNSGTLVYSYRPDAQVDPSGMNKIMTALLALELGDPNTVVTVTRKALDSVAIGSVSANLKRYEEIRLIDLLYCMMVGSANDAAAVIAEHIGGSQEAFVAMMNQRAIELGCKNTNFVNPTGITAKDQSSTARDLAVITEKALENETFRQMFCAVSYEVPKTNKSEVRTVHTTNYLMSKEDVKDQLDPRVTGGKTGAVSTTDRSLICTAEQNGSRYLSVVMQASGTVTEDGMAAVTFGSFEETRDLLDFGFQQYGVFSLLRGDQVVERFAVSGGENSVSVCAKQPLKVSLPQEAQLTDVQYQSSLIQGLRLPIRAGQEIGYVQVWYDGICIGQSELVAMHDVYARGSNHVILEPTEHSRIQRNWKSVLLIGAAVVLALLAAGGTVLLVLRLRAGRKYRSARKHTKIRERV